jgi:hypothetical protein
MQTYSLVRHKKAIEWCYTQLGDLLRADFQFKDPTECLRDNGFKANFESQTAKAPNTCKLKINYTNICPLNFFSLTARTGYWRRQTCWRPHQPHQDDVCRQHEHFLPDVNHQITTSKPSGKKYIWCTITVCVLKLQGLSQFYINLSFRTRTHWHTSGYSGEDRPTGSEKALCGPLVLNDRPATVIWIKSCITYSVLGVMGLLSF